MKHLANGGNWTRNYEYSETNNRLIKTTVGADISVFDYTHYPHHPKHGFMTGMPHLQVMEWNFKEELSAVARQRRENGGTPETTYYVYDAEGRRVRKITENTAGPGDTPTKKCERIYVDGIEIYRDYTGNHPGLERKTLHIMDDTSRIAMIETRNEVNDGSSEKLVRYQLSNHLGSATLETDDSVAARVISYEEYHPYGTTAYQAMNEDIKAAGKRYRYTGKERDDESGFNYHGARYYAPWLGRWMSCDPAIFVISDTTNDRLDKDKKQSDLSRKIKLNQNKKYHTNEIYNRSQFNYVANNSINYIDPDGKNLRIIGTEDEIKKIIHALEYISSTSLEYETAWKVKNKIEVEIVDFKIENPLKGFPDLFKDVAENYFLEEQNYLNRIIKDYKGIITIKSVADNEIESLALVAGPAAYDSSKNEVQLAKDIIEDWLKKAPQRSCKYFYRDGGFFSSHAPYELWDVLAHELFGHAIIDIEYETTGKKTSREQQEKISRRRANKVREIYNKMLRCETCE